MKGKTTCGDEEDASEMEAKPSSLSQRSRCGRGRGFTACPSFPPQRASDLKSCCTDAFHGRACSSECRESEPGNGDHESHQRTDQKGGFPSFRDESQWEKHYEDIFFTSSQLEVIRRCKIERRMSDQGLYSESCMSQAIEKLGNNVTEAKRMGEVTTHNYEQFCVRNEKASSFFSRYVWPATVDSGYKQGRSEEEILIVIEVLRRSHRVVKNRLFSNMNNVTGFRIVFDSWWNYALLRILHLSPEVNHLSPEVNVRGKSIYEFTAVKIMTSLFDFITKDLGDFLKRGTLRDFHKNMGVDLVENVNHTRRILDHCDVLDMECSAVENHVNNLLNQSSPVASRARKEPVPQSILDNLVAGVAGAKAAAPSVPPTAMNSTFSVPPKMTRGPVRDESTAGLTRAKSAALVVPPTVNSTYNVAPTRRFRPMIHAPSNILYYEAPVVKPLLPGIANDSDISAADSICSPLTYSNDLQEMSGGEQCAICLDRLVGKPYEIPVRLKVCDHKFHLNCLRDSMKLNCSYKCPVCQSVLLPAGNWDFLRGNMPSGQMSCQRNYSISCAGYEGCGIITITYVIHSFRQKSYHPNPGQFHGSAWRTAYLPDNQEGQDLLCRLTTAFLCGLTLTVGTSLTTNAENSVTWAGIHHKTSPNGGTACHGYPDVNYLLNCNAELDAVGLPSLESCAVYLSSKGANYLPTQTVPGSTVTAPRALKAAPAAPPNYGGYQNGAVFYEQRARSLFTTVEGSQKRHLSPILDKIGSQEFIQFVEGNSIVDPAVEINPHVYRLDMYQNFVEEGFKCAAEGDHYDVRIVFHGTPESNIESILRNGLDPNLRKRQAFGQGEYFARNAALPVLYCCGGTKILVFAVITTEADNRHRDIIVVERRQRQLPIATLSFASLEGSAAMDAAVAFQSQVSRLWREKLEKEKVASEAKLKEKIIHCILQMEYEAASDIYKKACGDDGKPPNSWAEEVALYVRDHIRDDEFVGFYFPNLPPRPSDYRTVQTLNSEKCEVEAEKARQAYDKMRNGK